MVSSCFILILCYDGKIELVVHFSRAIKMLLNTQKALGSGTFVCRTMQHAAFLLSLTKSWSIEDTDFDPEDDIQLVRVPTIDFDSDDDDPLAD